MTPDELTLKYKDEINSVFGKMFESFKNPPIIRWNILKLISDTNFEFIINTDDAYIYYMVLILNRFKLNVQSFKIPPNNRWYIRVKYFNDFIKILDLFDMDADDLELWTRLQ